METNATLPPQAYDESAVRHAVYEALPEECRDLDGFACGNALEHTFRNTERAIGRRMTPEEAVEFTWGSIGACCKAFVEVETVPLEVGPSASRHLVDASQYA